MMLMFQIDLETIVQAKKDLKKFRRKTTHMLTMSNLSGEPDGRLLCPFCLYTSKKNKTSAIIKKDVFKCFHCNKSGRVR